jgi:hypothetical protein
MPGAGSPARYQPGGAGLPGLAQTDGDRGWLEEGYVAVGRIYREPVD